MELSISLLLQAIYLLIVTTLIVKFIHWFVIYVYKWHVVNKIPCLPITILIIGNIHYLNDRLSNDYFTFNDR
jgi:vancomycin permeability regulator SanA